MDRVKYVKLENEDGTYSNRISLSVDSDNININDGTLTEYVEDNTEKVNKKPYYYNNVADMKADIKLKAGDMAITLGYYEINDGGNATYRIVNDESEIDFQEELENGKYGSLIIENGEVNVNQCGIIGDNETDIGMKLNSLFSKLKSQSKIYFPNGKYLTSVTIDCDNDFDLEFESSYSVIKAISEMETLFIYNKSRKTSHVNRGYINNGTFDCNDLCNVGFEMNNAAAFELNMNTITNFKEKGFVGKGESTIASGNGGFRVYNMVCRNYRAYSGSIGFYCNCNDTCFDNCVAINTEISFYNTRANTFIKCHPWITFTDLYEDSIAFYHDGSYSLFVDCIVDSIRCAFKNKANTIINALNIECYSGDAFFNKELQEEYPSIFHDGSESNALINATCCRTYYTYGNNVVATTYHSDSGFYNCIFRTSSQGSIDFTNYINKSDTTYTTSNRSFLTNIEYNDYYNEFKRYFISNNSTSTNKPSSNSGFLDVLPTGLSYLNSLRCIQRFTELSTNKIFERTFNGTNWTNWKLINENVMEFTNVHENITNNSKICEHNDYYLIHIDITGTGNINAWTPLMRIPAISEIYTNKIIKYNDASFSTFQVYGNGQIAIGGAIQDDTRYVGDFIVFK